MGNASDMKHDNTIAIIKLLQREGGMTKSRMASMLNLSVATVHNIVTELKEKGFCRESGVVVSTGGRHAVIHEINREGTFIVGQTLFRNKIVTALFDYGLNMLSADTVDLKNLHDVSGTISLMAERIQNCIQKNRGRKCVGVGISMPGRADRHGKVLHIPGYPEWRNVLLTDILASEINLPIFVENDINALTLSLKWGDDTKGYRDVVFYDVAEGVGTGVLIGGKLFRGSSNSGCELGHVSVMVDGGPLCTCGNRGCLESFVKDAVILEQINELEDYRERPVRSMEEAIAECGKSEEVSEIFARNMRYIMIGAEHIVKLFNPELIVIHSSWLPHLPKYYKEMKDRLFAGYSGTESGRLRIMLLDDSQISYEIASACVFLDRFYSGADTTWL